MNCVVFRRALDSEPGYQSPEMLSHRRECPGCDTFARRQEAFERKLGEAVRIDVPEDLWSHVLLAHSLRLKGERRVGRRRLLVSLAAGLVLGLAVSWLALRPGPLEREVVSHVEKEAFLLQERGELSPAQINEALAPLDITVAGDLGAVHYAGTCWVRTGFGAHLVLSGEKGPITVLILPGEQVAGRIPIRGLSILEPRFQGIIAPTEGGSIAIVGAPGEAFDVIEERVRRSLRSGSREGRGVADRSSCGRRGARDV